MVWAPNMFAACEWEQWWMSLFCGSNTWVWPAKLHQPHIIYTLFNTYHFNISVVHLLLSEMKSSEFWSFLTVKSFIRNAKPSTADLQRYKKIHREIQRFNVYFLFIYYVIWCAGWQQLCHCEFVFLIVWKTETTSSSLQQGSDWTLKPVRPVQ